MTIHYPKCTTIAILEGAVDDLSCLNRLKVCSIVGCEWTITNHLRSGTGNKCQAIYSHLGNVPEGKPNIETTNNPSWHQCTKVTKYFQLVDTCYGQVCIDSVITWQ